MPESPRASIVINNYGYGRFLGEAIESALQQTYRNTEVIVVDDGSTDNSREVMRSFGSRVTSVFKENGGQGSAYNAGFELCGGDIVCFLDADDTVAPEAMEQAVALMRGKRVVKVQWPLRVVDAAGMWRGDLSTRKPPPAGDLLARLISDGPLYDFAFTTGAAYRRGFLNDVFPVPEPPYRNGGDVYLLTLAPVWGVIRNADQPLGTYRAHGRNNYRDRPLNDDRVRDCIRRFETNCSVLQVALARHGFSADVEQWKKRNFNYVWPTRLLQAKQDIERLVPAGASYVLVNGREWGGGEPVPGRHNSPFLERDGEDWGAPVDDDSALAALEHHCASGATHLLFWYTCFWWLDKYKGLHALLRHRSKCVISNERLIGFSLQG